LSDFDFEITVGDRLPVLRATLQGGDGKPLQLPSGSTCKLRMWKEGSYATPVINNQDCTFITQNTGADPNVLTEVQYDWDADDTIVGGVYRARFILQHPDSRIVTVPNGDEYLLIGIIAPV
jgi:hypothetical protein